jgi:hypothetical protein
MRFKLTAKANQNTGEIGWLDSRIRGSDVFEPLSYPIGLAHDCIEHAAFGSVADEIEAHGAMYRIRYEGGWCDPFGGNSLNLDLFAAEWVNLFQGLSTEPYLPTPRKTRPLDSAVEEDISEIIELGQQMIRDELSDADADDIRRIADVFRAYFRIGYRNVAKRFKGLPAYEIAHLFSELAQAFKRRSIEYEGQEIEVTVDLKARTVRIEEVYEEVY